jgi:hypothetical protein
VAFSFTGTLRFASQLNHWLSRTLFLLVAREP